MRQSWKCKHTNWILDDFEKLLFTFFFLGVIMDCGCFQELLLSELNRNVFMGKMMSLCFTITQGDVWVDR